MVEKPLCSDPACLADRASSVDPLKSSRNCRFQQQEHFHGQFFETLRLGREILTQSREEAQFTIFCFQHRISSHRNGKIVLIKTAHLVLRW